MTGRRVGVEELCVGEGAGASRASESPRGSVICERSREGSTVMGTPTVYAGRCPDFLFRGGRPGLVTGNHDARVGAAGQSPW